VTDTEIVVTLSGGKVGNFYTRVYIEGLGNNLNSGVEFSYAIKINSISPSGGSIYGGQILTISGEHFSNKIADNYVYF
jgi:hypothetical protein